MTKEEVLRQFKQDKINFYNDPMHWSNNKRRRKGLPVLRKESNKKNRTYYSTSLNQFKIFNMLEELLDETLPKAIQEEMNKFADIKDIPIGDRK